MRLVRALGSPRPRGLSLCPCSGTPGRAVEWGELSPPHPPPAAPLPVERGHRPPGPGSSRAAPRAGAGAGHPCGPRRAGGAALAPARGGGCGQGAGSPANGGAENASPCWGGPAGGTATAAVPLPAEAICSARYNAGAVTAPRDASAAGNGNVSGRAGSLERALG